MISGIDLTEGKLVSKDFDEKRNPHRRILPWMSNEELLNYDPTREIRKPWCYTFPIGSIRINDDYEFITTISSSTSTHTYSIRNNTWTYYNDTFDSHVPRWNQTYSTSGVTSSSSTSISFNYINGSWVGHSIGVDGQNITITYAMNEPSLEWFLPEILRTVTYACDVYERPSLPSWLSLEEKPRYTWDGCENGMHLLFFNDDTIEDCSECREWVVRALADGYSREEVEEVLRAHSEYSGYESYESMIEGLYFRRNEDNMASHELLDPNSSVWEDPGHMVRRHFSKVYGNRGQTMEKTLSNAMPWIVDELRDVWRSTITLSLFEEYMSSHWHEITNPVLRDYWFHFNGETHNNPINHLSISQEDLRTRIDTTHFIESSDLTYIP